MSRTLLFWIALVSVAHADGLPYGKGPCDDVELCEQACAHNAAACTWGGHLLLRSGLDTNKARAGALYEKGCAKGDAEACWRAGLVADPGPGDGHNDRRRARGFYDRACTGQLLRGCFSLAKLDGAPGDDKAKRAGAAAIKRAVAIYEAACAKKDADACDEAGTLYIKTLELRDEKKATAFHDRACVIRTGSPCAAPAPPPQPSVKKSQPVEMTVYAALADVPTALAGAVPAGLDFTTHSLAIRKDLRVDARYMDFVVQAPSPESYGAPDAFTVVISQTNECHGGAYRGQHSTRPEEPEEPGRKAATKIVKATHPIWIVPHVPHVWLEYWTTWRVCPPVP